MSGTYSNLPPVMSHTTMRANFLQSLQVFTQFAVQVTGCELLNIKTQVTVYNITYKLASQSRQHMNMPNQNTNGINSLCTSVCRLRLKYDGTHAETRFCLSEKRTSPLKSAGHQSTTGSEGVRISSSNAGYTMFRGNAKGTGYPLHSPVSPFTSSPVRHRVPPHFNWTLTRCIIKM